MSDTCQREGHEVSHVQFARTYFLFFSQKEGNAKGREHQGNTKRKRTKKEENKKRKGNTTSKTQQGKHKQGKHNEENTKRKTQKGKYRLSAPPNLLWSLVLRSTKSPTLRCCVTKGALVKPQRVASQIPKVSVLRVVAESRPNSARARAQHLTPLQSLTSMCAMKIFQNPLW